jgi:hypothetical protein
MRYVSVGIAVLSLGAGLIADWYWYKASRVQVVPFWQNDTGVMEPLDVGQGNTAWIMAQLQTTQKSGRLNGIAALWTAVAVILGGMSSIASSVFSN